MEKIRIMCLSLLGEQYYEEIDLSLYLLKKQIEGRILNAPFNGYRKQIGDLHACLCNSGGDNITYLDKTKELRIFEANVVWGLVSKSRDVAYFKIRVRQYNGTTSRVDVLSGKDILYTYTTGEELPKLDGIFRMVDNVERNRYTVTTGDSISLMWYLTPLQHVV